jgi:hypothetical protein
LLNPRQGLLWVDPWPRQCAIDEGTQALGDRALGARISTALTPTGGLS